MSSSDSGGRPGGLTALAVINFIFCGLDVLLAIGMAGVLLIATHTPELPVATTTAPVQEPEHSAAAGKVERPAVVKPTTDGTADVKRFNNKLRIIKKDVAAVAVSLVGNVVCALLLLISGIGYLHQFRILGRYVGSAYAVVSLLGTAFALHAGGTGRVGVGAALSLIVVAIYPIVTLAMVHLVFRDDLAN